MQSLYFGYAVSADRNASGESSQDTALTNIKTIAKIQALFA